MPSHVPPASTSALLVNSGQSLVDNFSWIAVYGVDYLFLIKGKKPTDLSLTYQKNSVIFLKDNNDKYLYQL